MQISKAELRAIVREDLALEYNNASILQRNLAEARNRLYKELESNPDSLSKRNLKPVLDQYLSDLDAGFDPEKSLRTGQKHGKEIVGIGSGAPKNSAYWRYTPVLPINAISQERSRASALIKEASEDLKQDILRKVQVGLALGAGHEQILQDVLGTGLKGVKGRDGVFRKASVRAETIGRTVTNELINKGAMYTYDEINGICPELNLKKIWNTVSDKRTSQRCESLSGQVRELNENFSSGDGWGGQYPPSHPNCRSRVTTLSEKYVKEKMDPKFEKAANQKQKETKEPPKEPTKPKLDPSLVHGIDPGITAEDLGEFISGMPNGDAMLNYINSNQVKTYWFDLSKDLEPQVESAFKQVRVNFNREEYFNHTMGLLTKGTNPGWVNVGDDMIYMVHHSSNTGTGFKPNLRNCTNAITAELTAKKGEIFSFGEGVSTKDLYGVVYTHEFGHILHNKAGRPPVSEALLNSSKTTYGATNNAEWFAEHTAAYQFNPGMFKKQYPEAVPVVEALINDAFRPFRGTL